MRLISMLWEELPSSVSNFQLQAVFSRPLRCVSPGLPITRTTMAFLFVSFVLYVESSDSILELAYINSRYVYSRTF